VKNNKPGKNKINTSSLKKSYYITLENAGQRTQGRSGYEIEDYIKMTHTVLPTR